MKRCIQLLALLGLVVASPLSAALISYAAPDAAYLGTFTRLLPVTGNDGDEVNFVTDGITTASFSSSMMVGTVPFTWATWGSPPDTESNTPRVLDSLGVSALSIGFSGTIYGVGFEAEPMIFDIFNLTAHFYSGATYLGSISRNVDGYYGARLFAAWSTSLAEPITRVDFSAPFDANGFALAQIRVADNMIPEPSKFWLLATGVLAWAGSRRWRRR